MAVVHGAMRIRNAKAFTLIEVMAALAIVSTALLALLRLHLVSVRTADKAQITTQAVFLAQEKMAEALSAGYPPIGTKTGTAEIDGCSFTWRTKVTDARPPQQSRSNFRLGHMRQLSVDVTWQTGPGGKQVELTTYAAENKIRE